VNDRKFDSAVARVDEAGGVGLTCCLVAAMRGRQVHLVAAALEGLGVAHHIAIGTGVDVVDARIERAAVKASRKIRHVVVVDQNEQALDLATARIANIHGKDVTGSQVCGRIQDLELSAVCDNDRVMLVGSCACLHHLARADRDEFIKRALSWSVPLVIAELEGNHDSPSDGSAELVYSAYTFYRSLIKDATKSGLHPQELHACVVEFLLRELMPLLRNGYLERGNYHMVCWSTSFRAFHLPS